MNRSNAEMHGSESQSRFVQQRVDQVEKNFGLLCQTFGSIARKNARLRDKEDILATQIMAHAGNESINTSTRSSLKEFVGNFSTVQDYRQAQIERLESKVIKPLSYYGNTCKSLKSDLKAESVARKKEMKQQQTLRKIQQKNPTNSGQVSQAENELQRARVDSTMTSRNLEESMDRFEKNKITDLKKVLSDFLKIEMVFHTKALEYLSKCHQHIEDIDEEEDLVNFRNSIREHGGTPAPSSEGRAGDTLDWTGSGVSSPGDTMTTTAREQATPNSSGMYGTDGDLDNDDDDDDDLSDDEDDYNYRR